MYNIFNIIKISKDLAIPNRNILLKPNTLNSKYKSQLKIIMYLIMRISYVMIKISLLMTSEKNNK